MTPKTKRGKTKPEAAATHKPPVVPFSENLNKPARGTRQELISDLMFLVKQHPDSVISRNFYRVNGSFAESAWTCIFGTFNEFKHAAGVTPTRHAQLLEKHVAKHESTARYKEIGEERKGWGEAYAISDPRRFQTHAVITDVHDKEADPFTIRVFLDTIKRAQPSRVIYGGDLFDLPEFGKYGVDPREWDVVGRIRAAHGFLAAARKAAPDARHDLIEGNHEFRLLRHLAEATPAMRAVLSDLHGFTVARLLGLDTFEVNYIARADLATFHQKDILQELRLNYLVVNDAYMIDHFPNGRARGMPGMNGHHHQHFVWSAFSPMYQTHEWHQLGCAHRRIASYTPGERWGNGFALVHVDTVKKRTAIEYIDTTHDHACVGGRHYHRVSSETFPGL